MSASTIPRLPELHHDHSDTENTDVLPNHLNWSGSKTNIPGPNTADSRLIYHIRKGDILLLLGIIVMLCWPWVIFGVFFARGSIRLTHHFANYLNHHYRNITFFITQSGAIVNLIVGFLFSRSILRYSQGWMAPKENISFFHLSLIFAFRTHRLPWRLSDRKYLLTRKRWIRAALVLACIYASTFIAPGVTTLLTPLPIGLQAALQGTELDFSPNPNATTCLEWLNAQATSMTNTCQWKKYKDLNYNTCGDGEMTDILESGRLNVLSIPQSDFEVITAFSGLGVQSGLRVSKPLRGTLPIGPNGVHAFGTLNSSQLEDLKATLQNNSDSNYFPPFYTYTLHQQGITSNISCSRDSQSPVQVYPSDQGAVGTVQFNGTCDGQDDVFPNVKTFTSLNSNNSLTFWACKSTNASYLLYLRGLQNYAESIGNITCTASIQPAILPVKYDSYFGVFRSHDVIETFPTTFSGFIDRAVGELGTIIADGQTQELNLVADSVTALGVRYFGLPADGQQDEYLPLYEAMLQGILEYEVAYTRLLYSTFTGRPPSCDRIVEGSTIYTELGWWVDIATIGYLLPMTIINLASLILLLVAMFRTKKGSFKDDPTDPEILASAKPGHRIADKHDKMGRRLFYPADG